MFSDDEGHDEHQVCVTSSEVGHVNLRMPYKEEIDWIIVEMISQVHSNYNWRKKIVNSDVGKPFGIFIKDITHKIKDENKEVKAKILKIKETEA